MKAQKKCGMTVYATVTLMAKFEAKRIFSALTDPLFSDRPSTFQKFVFTLPIHILLIFSNYNNPIGKQ